MFGSIGKLLGGAKTISGLAKKATGSVSGVREILSFNPQISPFKFPPQVQMGVELLNGGGIKVPSPEDLIGLAQGKIDMILKGVRAPLLGILGKTEQQLTDKLATAEEVLQKIEWLL